MSFGYSYNADGLRTKKTVGSQTYTYYWNGSQLAMMTVKTGNTTLTLKFYYDAEGTPFYFDYNGTKYFYITNLQGDVVGIANENGIVGYYEYDAWGRILSINSASSNEYGALTSNPLRYRGYIYDNETGFYYLQTRYYDPAIRRFINADNYVYTGQDFTGYNMFAYCGNNPVNKMDPTGEFFFTILGGVIGAITGAIDSAIMGGSFEDIAKGALAGAASGAISGAGVDIGVLVTAASGGTGVGAGLAIAGSFGAIGSIVGTGISNDWQGDPMEYVASALVGGMTNMISFGLAPIGGEIVKGPILNMVNNLCQEGVKDLAMNIATGVIVAVGATWIMHGVAYNG